jgi:hypothetical protein
MITLLIEILSGLIKEKHLNLNTAISIVILCCALVAFYLAKNNGVHLDGIDSRLGRIDNHLQSEDTDIGLVRQALSDHGIHVNKSNHYEAPKNSNDEEDSRDTVLITNLSNVINNQNK